MISQTTLAAAARVAEHASRVSMASGALAAASLPQQRARSLNIDHERPVAPSIIASPGTSATVVLSEADAFL